MKTVAELLPLSTTYLQERGIQKPRRLAEDLIAAALKLKRIDLYLQFDRPLIEEELRCIREWVKRCGKGEPLDYVVGQVEFLGCSIRVDSRVLIPRPETEIMADLVVKKLGADFRGVCWDLCTGSGCLGIALKRAAPGMRVVLSDLSDEALALAKENVLANGVEVEVRKGDLWGPFKGETADVIVSNPPYISIKEYAELDPSVRDHEPRMALVGGERGVEFYERLQGELSSKLNPGGRAFFEIGFNQGEEVRKIFSRETWASSEVRKDWAGHDRFFFLEKQ